MPDVLPLGGFTTLVDMLRARAADRPDGSVYSFLGDDGTTSSLTFAELDRRARDVAARIQARTAPGDRVLLLLPPGLDYIISFYGCFFAGVVAVPAFPPDASRLKRGAERIQAIAADADASLAITTRAVVDSGALALSASLARFPVLVADDDTAGAEDAWRPPAIGPRDVALLQYTSGSTTTPRGVMLTHENMLHNAVIQRRAWNLSEASIGVSWLPLYHDLGVITCLVQPVFTAFPTVMMSPLAFMQRPMRWLRAISEHRATFAGGPNFAFDLCVRKSTPEERASLDLSSWDRAFNGAEPIRPETLAAFLRAFGPSGFRAEAMYPCYGMAEANFLSGGLAARALPVVRTFDRDELGRGRAVVAEHGRSLVGCGTWQTEQDIRIVDPETRRLRRDGEQGEIWVGGPSVAQGYWRRDEESEETFRARIADGDPDARYLRTGDLGFVVDGELFVAGRLKDLLIVRGRNHYPQDIERTVERVHPSLRAGCGAAFSVEVAGEERVVVVQESDADPSVANEIFAKMRQAIAEEHELPLFAATLIRPGTVPKTTSGKIQRRATKKAFLDGTLDAVASWRLPEIEEAKRALVAESKRTRAAIQAWLVGWLAPRLGVSPDELDVREPLARWGLDSRTAVDLSADLGTWLGRDVPATIAYAHPSVAALAAFFASDASSREAAQVEGRAPSEEPIAVVGIACRFPGAPGPDEYWQLLRSGVDAVTEVPPSRWNADAFFHPDASVPGKTNSRWGGFLPEIDRFDPLFFGMSPREAAHVDPQQRLLLEVAWEALEDAGIAGAAIAGSPTGVFVGITTDDYGKLQWSRPRSIDAYSATGTFACIAANRISYALDLRGPSVAIDTACSSSLVAIHAACQSLWSGESTIALAGGVNLILAPENTISQSKLGALAADGKCKAFDARADGFVRGEGAGVVVLKRLSQAIADGDRIYALVRGTAVNQDGRSNGLTAPSPEAQKAVLREAYRHAGVRPGDVQVVEAHGTGTRLGDPIEAGALGDVLADGRAAGDRCAIGSVKTNIGHLESAAGIAGFVKMVLAIAHGEIPPSLHHASPNPEIPFDRLPLRVVTALEPWPERGGGRLAGVSSFGMGGTNAHVVLSDAPAPGTRRARSEGPFVLPLSAKSPTALRERARALSRALGTLDPVDVAFTAGARSEHHEHRLAVVGGDRDELRALLDAFARGEASRWIATGARPTGARPRLVFVFSGHGSQHAGMGRSLLASEPVFDAAIRRCDRAFAPHLGWSIAEALAGDGRDFDRFDRVQPLLFAVQVGLAALWRSRGVVPDAVVGHSLGEIAAAHVTGALSLEEAAAIVALRSTLLVRVSGRGAMAVVGLPLDETRAAIESETGRLAVAVSNSPTSTVIAGDADALARALERLRANDVFCKPVQVDVAAHCHLVDPFRAELVAGLSHLRPLPAHVPIYSSVVGGEVPGETLDAEHWGRHLREPVLFANAVRVLAERGHSVFLELAPHPILTTSVQQGLAHAKREGLAVASLRRDEPEQKSLLAASAALHCAGLPIDFARHFDGPARVVSLPRYPWQRQRHWLDASEAREAESAGRHPLLRRWLRDANGAGRARGEIDVSTSSPAFVTDHVVQGVPVVPSLAFAEMAREAAVEAFGPGSYAIEDLRLVRALFVPEGTSWTVQVVVSPDAEGVGTFEIASRAADDRGGSWTRHATGRIARAGAPAPVDPAVFDGVLARCTELVTDDAFHAGLEAQGMHFGPRFRGIERLWRRDGESLVEVTSPRALAGESDGYPFHPALLDACARALVATTSTTRAFMPVSIERVRAGNAPRGRIFAHAELRDREGSGVLRGDVRVYSETGRLVAEIVGARLQLLDEIGASGAGERVDDWRHRVAWSVASEDEPSVSKRDAGGSWIVLADRRGVGARLVELLRARGARCVVIHAGDAFAKIGDEELFASASRIDDVRAAIASALEGGRCDGVVHLWSLDAPGNADAARDEARDLGTTSAIAIVQELASRAEAPALFAVTRGGVVAKADDPPAIGAQAALWGAGRTLAVEHAPSWGRLVDLDPRASVADAAEALATELARASSEDQVALRGGGRFVPRLVRAHAPAMRRPIAWRPDATYLVTGGLGGIGLAVARWMVEQGARRLLLVGRSPLPPRAAWKSVPEGSPAAARIAAIRAIEALGASVHVAAVDVGDAAALARCLDAFEDEGWPRVRGVVHAAAVSNTCAASSLDVAAIDADFRPKVVGAWALDRWLGDRPLDFFVAFSSLSAVLPSPLLASYAAANAFVDALVLDRRARGLEAATIDWGMWSEVGLSARHQETTRERGWAVGAFSTEQGLDAFGDALASGDPELVLTRMDWRAYAEAYPTAAATPMLRDLVGEVGGATKRAQGAAQERVDLLALPNEEREARVREVLGTIAARVLRLGEARIDPAQALDALGLDSLMAAELRNAVAARFGASLPIVAFLRKPTLGELATRVVAAVGEGAEKPSLDATIARPRAGDLPLSPAQEGIAYLDELAPGSTVYFMTLAYRIDGPLDAAALETALEAVVARHEALRTTFPIVDGRRVQRIAQRGTVTLAREDLSHVAAEEREHALEAWLAREARKPADLAKGPLFRAGLVRVGEREHVLALGLHHIIVDGWSIRVMTEDLTAYYATALRAEAPTLPMLEAQLADWVGWQAKLLGGAERERLVAHWRSSLEGAPALLALPTDRPRPAVQSFAGATVPMRIPAELVERAAAVARSEGATLFMVLVAATAVVLGRHASQEDLVLGSPVANRGARELERSVGFLNNMLPLRVRLGGEPSFRDLLARVRDTALGAYDHQELPVAEIIKELRIPRDPSFSPLFQVELALQPPMPPIELPGCTGRVPEIVEDGTSRFDLYFDLVDRGGDVAGGVEYNTDLFDPETVERIASEIVTLLDGATRSPDSPVAELSLLDADAERRVLVDWNRTEVPYPDDVLVHGLIEARAARSPDAVAVVFEGRRITYRELEAHANRLAHELVARGVEPDARVALVLERSVEMVVAILAVLKAGGAYVPIDPEYPPARVATMASDAAPRVLLTQAKLRAAVERCVPAGTPVLAVDADAASWASHPETPPSAPVAPKDLAYVIYTSGSTGQPKGAMNTHHALANRLLWMQDAYALDATDRVLQKTPYTFDVSVWEFLWPLMIGATLVVAKPGGHRDPAYLRDLVVAERITTLHFVPSMLQAFVVEDDVERCTSLRRVICSGEALPFELTEAFFARSTADLHNLYGPTETAIDVTAWQCVRGSKGRRVVPIGKPIANTRIYVLDAHGRPVPIGVAGELHIAGRNVGRGYLGRPELTKEKFVADPFATSPDARMYRTGDLVRWMPDGNLEYLGRLDHQVKLRGLRIELGEIEDAIDRHPAVQECVVVLASDERGQRLVAHWVAKPGAVADAASLREALAERLPEYMIPSTFVRLDAMPLLSSGKVNRAALPPPDGATSDERSPSVEPRTDLERAVADGFARVLGIRRPGVHDDFFLLGGHSLLAARLVFELRRSLGVDVPLGAITRAPTVARLAALLSGEHVDDVEPRMAIDAALDPTIRRAESGEGARVPFESALLTGATGFVGSFLLHELLHRTSATIHCLVRASSASDGRRRILEGLARYGLSPADAGSRIVAVPGDLERPLLGLDDATFDALANSVDAIFHSGAAVNFIRPYTALRPANVLGTREILRFAARGRPKVLHHLSTIAVLAGRSLRGLPVLAEEPLGEGAEGLPNSYAQSKWVAERLVQEAARRGIPVAIHRLGQVVGHSTTGVAQTGDFVAHFLRGCLQLGSTVRSELSIDLVPVDFVAQAVVAIARRVPSPNGAVHHIVNPRPAPWSTLVAMLRDLGHPLAEHDFATWYRPLVDGCQAGSDNALTPYLAMLDEVREAMASIPRFDATRVSAALEGTGIACPAVDARLVRTLLGFYAAAGVLPGPRGAFDDGSSAKASAE